MWAGERESKSAGKEGRKDGKDGWKRERGDERVGGEEGKKRKAGIGKEGEKAGQRAAYSLKQEGTICLQFCCVISKKGSRYWMSVSSVSFGRVMQYLLRANR